MVHHHWRRTLWPSIRFSVSQFSMSLLVVGILKPEITANLSLAVSLMRTISGPRTSNSARCSGVNAIAPSQSTLRSLTTLAAIRGNAGRGNRVSVIGITECMTELLDYAHREIWGNQP